MHIDDVDARLLAREGAATSAQLGERVALSASAVHRRVRLLEEQGLIAGYRAVLSRQARGNPSTAFVSVTLDDQREETIRAFEQAARARPEITEAHLMTGQFDFLLKVEVREDDSFERVHSQVLSKLPGVQRLMSQISIRAIVED